MRREEMIKKVEENPKEWDVIIIGGGAVGLGIAVDSASRGYKTLLLEQADFAKATSSRSTKLIHGGLRYLQQGNIGLVVEALKERGLLCKNAPHLVHHLPFLVPNYRWWEGPFYGIGLKVYDMLAGSLGLEPSKRLTRKQTLKQLPTLESKELKGGALYYDGQFDDARLAITLAHTAIDHGACLINYMKVTDFIKEKGLLVGVKSVDQESKKRYSLYGKVIIQATGVFSDALLKKDNKKAKPMIQASQGIHLVLPKKFLPSSSAILVPHTDDNRVIFMIPWHGRMLLGTTDTEREVVSLEPKPLQEEIDFLLRYAAKYLNKIPKKEDVLSVYAGLRPLIKKESSDTSSLSREHAILVSLSGLITVAGGKWTTYRKMAEDAVNKAISIGGLVRRPCITEHLPLHGYTKKTLPGDPFSLYGSDFTLIKKIQKEKKLYKEKLHPHLPYLIAEVIWAARKEMARTVEDVLARRTRSLLLDAKASIEVAPLVATLLANELKKPKKWVKEQVESYTNLASHYSV